MKAEDIVETKGGSYKFKALHFDYRDFSEGLLNDFKENTLIPNLNRKEPALHFPLRLIKDCSQIGDGDIDVRILNNNDNY